MSRNEEQKLILNMLEDGQITAEEAQKLLDALGDEPSPSPGPTTAGEELKHIPDVVKGALQSIKGSGFFGFGSSVSYEREVTGGFSAKEGPVDVSMAARNGLIQVSGWDEEGFRLVIKTKVRGGDKEAARDAAENFCRVETGDDRLMVDGRENLPPNTSVSLQCNLPKSLLYELDLHTSNGRVSVDQLNCRGVTAETSNGRVACSDVHSEQPMRLTTSNGRVKAESFTGGVRARTSNGRISLKPSQPEASCDYSAHTSNGSITLSVPEGEGLGISFEARTSNGKVKTAVEELEYEIDDRKNRRRSHVKAHTPGFDNAQVQLTADLKTSNGSIRLK